MRWADMDLQGHVNNVVYLDYLQEARVDLLRAGGPDARPVTQPSQGGSGVIVVDHRVSYRAPLVFRFRPVMVEVWVTEVRAASFALGYEVFQERDGARVVHLRATSTLAPFDFGADRPRRLTSEEKDGLARYLEPGERLGRLPWSPVPDSQVGHYPVRVRFSDVDVYGHVNNVTYFEYFMEARIRHTARLWRDLPEGTPDPSFVVAQADVDYRTPMTFRAEPYDCFSAVADVGTSSFRIDSEIREGETVFARSRVTLVFVDPATGRSAPPVPAFREALVAALGQ
jgi:acyl-CoA thioester hydrolase